MEDRRREPKGIPMGGQFAPENRGGADASDLTPAGPHAELPGGMVVGEGWSRTSFDHIADAGRHYFEDGEGGRFETYDTDWFDPNLGDCSSRRAKYMSPQGDTAVAYDMKVETEGRADISAYTPDDLKQAVSTAKHRLRERTGLEPERVEVELGEKPGAPMRVRAKYPLLELPTGFRLFKKRRIRYENLRRKDMEDDWVEVEP